MSDAWARQEWARHVREALEALPGLEARVLALGSEGADVVAWMKALFVVDVLLVEEAEALARGELGLSTPEPLRHRQCRGGR